MTTMIKQIYFSLNFNFHCVIALKREGDVALVYSYDVTNFDIFLILLMHTGYNRIDLLSH